MQSNKSKITITLSDANSLALGVVASIFGESRAKLLSFCLQGFNQPLDRGFVRRGILLRKKVQPTSSAKKGKRHER